MGKRVIFTGGSGKAGRHAIKYLVDKGYEVLNLDLVPLDNPKVQHTHHRPDRFRRGDERAVDAFRLRRIRARANCRHRSMRSSISPPFRAS